MVGVVDARPFSVAVDMFKGASSKATEGSRKVNFSHHLAYTEDSGCPYDILHLSYHLSVCQAPLLSFPEKVWSKCPPDPV